MSEMYSNKTAIYIILAVILTTWYYFYIPKGSVSSVLNLNTTNIPESFKDKQTLFQIRGTVKRVLGNVYTIAIFGGETLMDFAVPGNVTITNKSTSKVNPIEKFAGKNQVKIGSKVVIYSLKPPKSAEASDIVKIEVVDNF